MNNCARPFLRKNQKKIMEINLDFNRTVAVVEGQGGFFP